MAEGRRRPQPVLAARRRRSRSPPARPTRCVRPWRHRPLRSRANRRRHMPRRLASLHHRCRGLSAARGWPEAFRRTVPKTRCRRFCPAPQASSFLSRRAEGVAAEAVPDARSLLRLRREQPRTRAPRARPPSRRALQAIGVSSRSPGTRRASTGLARMPSGPSHLVRLGLLQERDRDARAQRSMPSSGERDRDRRREAAPLARQAGVAGGERQLQRRQPCALRLAGASGYRPREDCPRRGGGAAGGVLVSRRRSPVRGHHDHPSPGPGAYLAGPRRLDVEQEAPVGTRVGAQLELPDGLERWLGEGEIDWDVGSSTNGTRLTSNTSLPSPGWQQKTGCSGLLPSP